MNRDLYNALRWAVALSVIVAFATGLQLTAAEKKKEKKEQKLPSVTLEWPLPPDKPRIRFLGEISGATDVEPVRKKSFLERVGRIEPPPKVQLSLLKPYGVATDSRGRVYVTDTRQDEVFIFDRQNKTTLYLARQTQVPLKVPTGVAIDEKDGVWISDAGTRRVYAFDHDFNQVLVLGGHDEFESPSGIALDRQRRRLYVVDSRKHAVLVFDLDSGKPLAQFGKRGADAGQFNFPTNLAVGRDGRIYVVDTMNARVQVFDADYKFLDTWGTRGDRTGQFVRPKGIALDSMGNVYVVDADFCNVQIFDPSHRPLMALGSMGYKAGSFALPAGIHIDNEDRIYVTDQDNRRVQIFKLLDGSVVNPPQPGEPPGTQRGTKEGGQVGTAKQ